MITNKEVKLAIGDCPDDRTTEALEALASYTFELEARVAALEMKLARLLDAVPSAGFTESQPIIIPAQPSMGKSTTVRDLAIEAGILPERGFEDEKGSPNRKD